MPDGSDDAAGTASGFADLGLSQLVLRAIEEGGYRIPTPIQAGAIPPALAGRDVLGIAQTGTGKTASFTLPMVTRLEQGRARARMPRSLVLCPTRELAAQVAESFASHSRHVDISKALLIGGVPFREQDQLIDRGVDVLIATPGRLLDHFERGKLLLTGIETLVVDEADRMLDMGFIPDIERIVALTPFTRQTLFFSATMPPEIENLAATFLAAPARVEVTPQATAPEKVEQTVIMFRPSAAAREGGEKRRLLRDLIQAEGENFRNAIIFCNRKTEVDICSRSLRRFGHDAAAIHGDLDQPRRTATMGSFREGKIILLVASDVAARGLDIPAVSHVFNFDVPANAEDYVHRIGRTGRAGRSGKAITICLPHEEKALAAIERLTGTSIKRQESTAKGKSRHAVADGQDMDSSDRQGRSVPATYGTQHDAEAGGGKGGGRWQRKSSSGSVGGQNTRAAAELHLPRFITLSFEERSSASMDSPAKA